MVGTTVHEGIVSVRMYVRGERDAAEAATAELRQIVKERLGVLAFGEGEETLGVRWWGLLAAGKYTLSATAESSLRGDCFR